METKEELKLQPAAPILRLFGHIFDWAIGIILPYIIIGTFSNVEPGVSIVVIFLFLVFLLLQIVMMAKSKAFRIFF